MLKITPTLVVGKVVASGLGRADSQDLMNGDADDSQRSESLVIAIIPKSLENCKYTRDL